MPKVTTTKPFLKNLNRLSRADADLVISAMTLFMKEPNARSLNFEKVTSRSGYFTIRGSYSIRVLLELEDTDAYIAVAVGNHDYIYKSYFKR